MIIWLSSYPKSGNTWLRVLLTNYLFFEEKVFSNLNYIKEFPKKNFFKDLDEETNSVLPGLDLYKYFILSQDRLNLNNKINFLKTHSICGTINNYKFTNKENTFASLKLGNVFNISFIDYILLPLSIHDNMCKIALDIIKTNNKTIDDFKSELGEN